MASPQRAEASERRDSEQRAVKSRERQEPETREPMTLEGMVQGYPPRVIPKHGPAYLSLKEEEKLVRLHNNLGHPETSVLVKFLTGRKAEPRFVQAARGYACSTCHETTLGPKFARPSSIHQVETSETPLEWM